MLRKKVNTVRVVFPHYACHLNHRQWMRTIPWHSRHNQYYLLPDESQRRSFGTELVVQYRHGGTQRCYVITCSG